MSSHKSKSKNNDDDNGIQESLSFQVSVAHWFPVVWLWTNEVAFELKSLPSQPSLGAGLQLKS